MAAVYLGSVVLSVSSEEASEPDETPADRPVSAQVSETGSALCPSRVPEPDTASSRVVRLLTSGEPPT